MTGSKDTYWAPSSARCSLHPLSYFILITTVSLCPFTVEGLRLSEHNVLTQQVRTGIQMWINLIPLQREAEGQIGEGRKGLLVVVKPDLGNEHKLCLPAPIPVLFYDSFLISYCSLFSLGFICVTCLRDQDDSRIVTYWDLPDPRTFGNRLAPDLLPSQPNVPIYFYSLPCPYRTFLLLLAYLLTLSSACLSHVLGDQTTNSIRAGIIPVYAGGLTT